MPIENTNTIEGLNLSWPLAGDGVAEGDDHIRQQKDVLKTTFPGVGGNGLNAPIVSTEAELNKLSGMTSSTAELNVLTGMTKTTAELNDLVDKSSVQTITGVKTIESPVINTPTINAPAFTGIKGALIVQTANTSANPDVTVSFSGSIYNVGGIYSAGFPTRLTVQAGMSKVKLMAKLIVQANAIGYRRIEIRKNGLTTYAGAAEHYIYANDAALRTIISVETPFIIASPGDSFEVYLVQSSGSSLTVYGQANGSDGWFSMEVKE